MAETSVALVYMSLPRGGGSEKVIFEIVRGIDPNVVRPVVICLYQPGELGDELARQGHVVYSNLMASSVDLRGIIRIAQILRREECGVVYAPDGFLNTVVALLAAGRSVTVLGFHSYDTVRRAFLTRRRRWLLSIGDLLFFRRFDWYVALSLGHRDYLVREKGIPKDHLFIVPNGVDLSIGATGIRERNSEQVAIVAGLRKWKGHEVFLEAASLIRRARPSAQFVVAGDGPERERLQRMAFDLGIEDVQFLGNVSTIRDVMAESGVVVLSSWHEAQPLSILEAMAERTPVVATDVGSVAEVVEDGVSGFVVPPGRPELLAAAVLRILGDRDLAERMGEAGRARVEAEFSLEKSIRRYQTIFHDLGAGHRMGTPGK